jgi:hypothetical protein
VVATATVGSVLLLGASYVATTQLRPAEEVIAVVINDTGHEVRLTFCPRQDWAGQATTTLGDGDQFDLPPTAAQSPSHTQVPSSGVIVDLPAEGQPSDSVVIEATGHPTVCLTPLPTPTDGGWAETFTGRIDLPISAFADEWGCGSDLDSLRRG